MTGTDVAIAVEGLHKHFGPVKAVDGISFEVRSGEIFGFLGPNGAGKTTTIRCMMDFIRPTEGTITILGRDSHDASVALKNEIGYLPGNVRLYDKWTGLEHIRFVENLRGKSNSVADLVGKLSFDPIRKFKYYSSGNRQKLGLILALMHRPRIIVMDEPTLGLDPLLQNEIYQLLDELRVHGHTIFLSSHNLPEVERICDTVGIIKEGRLAGVEKVSELGKKSVRKVMVRFAGRVEPDDLKVKGVEQVEEVAGGFLLTVRSDINPVIQAFAQHKVLDVEIKHASLEDVFLKFYRRK